MSLTAVRLVDRAVVAVSGRDARDLLQNILTNDMHRLAPGRALYAALLTPQGKYLFDMFLAERDGTVLLDCEAARREDLIRRLMLYRLRASADIADASTGLAVWALLGDAAALPQEAGAAAPLAGGIVYRDPRCDAAGWRALLPLQASPYEALDAEIAEADVYERHRLALGLPDGARDMEPERTLALEADLDLLGAIDFDKGCYVGQELTARTKHRGKIRKRLLLLRVAGGAPVPGTPILLDGKTVGEVRSSAGAHAIALLRLEARHADGLEVDGRRVEPVRVEWMDEPRQIA